MESTKLLHDTPDTKGIEEELNIIDVLRGRAASYRLFSRLFFSPLSDADIDEFIARDFMAVATQFEDNDLLAEGFNDIGRSLRRRNTATRQQLATDFTMCFDGVQTVGGEVAVPYASVFLAEKALLNQEPRHEVYRIYKEEAVSRKGKVNLPEDHISFELDFLSVLSTRGAEALEAGDAAEALRNLDVSQQFITNNILTWFDLLAERANKVLNTRFYRGALKATRGYLDLDLQVISELREMLISEFSL